MESNVTQAQCEERRNTFTNINSKLMDKINEIHTTVAKIDERLDNHIVFEEKNTANIKWFIMLGLPLICALIGIIWNSLNGQIGEIQNGMSVHQSQIDNINRVLQEHENEDKQYYKYIKGIEK